MRKAISLFAAALFLLGVQDVAAQQKYIVKGTAANGADGDSILVQERVNRQYQTLAKGVVKNQQFSITGEVAEPKYVILTYGKDDNQLTMNFFLEEGTINAQLDKTNSVAEGTPLNNAYQKFRNEIKGFEEEDNQALSITKKHISLNKDNRVGATLLSVMQYAMNYPEITAFLASFSPEVQQLPAMVSLKELCDKAQATAVGKKFTDFTMNTPEGKPMKLSDYAGKGKVVLVDFWASWCGPCRQEMPNIVKAYEQYKDKGLEIVGVSLDRDAKSWTQALKKLNMTWPQMSDLKYWNSEGAQMYVVRSIPHTMLIDGDGTIIARGLHGEELMAKIAEALKK